MIKGTPEYRAASREVHAVLHAVRDWTAPEVAKAAKVSVTTVNNWCSGRTLFPRIDKLRAVAKAAGYRFALVPIQATIEDEVMGPVKRFRRKPSVSEVRAFN